MHGPRRDGRERPGIQYGSVHRAAIQPEWPARGLQNAQLLPGECSSHCPVGHDVNISRISYASTWRQC